MSHPGMVPEIAAATQQQPGHYTADFELTMGGDWYLVFRGRLPGGEEFELIDDLPGVLSE